MSDQAKTVTARKKRGPAPTGKGVQVVVRMQPDLLTWVDVERAKLDPVPSRPEFIRAILLKHGAPDG